MVMEIQSIQSVPQQMATQFYDATTGQIGTDTKKALTSLSMIGKLSQTEGVEVRKNFEESLGDIFQSHNKNFISTEDVIKSEMSGYNEKMALSAYKNGETSGIKPSTWDYVKGYSENLVDYIVNNPITAVIQAGTVGAVMTTKMPLYARIPVSIVSAMGIGMVTPAISRLISGKENKNIDYYV